jgi:hypothetical protein
VIAGVGVVVVVGIVLAVVLPSKHSAPPQNGTTTAPASAPSASGTRQSGADPTTTRAPATSVPAATIPHRATTTTAAPAVTTTSCRSVVHIGDSTSESLISADYIPVLAQRLSSRYAQVGAVHQNFQVAGARSIVETYEGQPNAYSVAQEVAASGYRGCWVVDMGVNDAADIAVGSNVGAAQRIQRMMSVIGNQPVLWVAVKTVVASGPYAERNMQAWNNTLLQACASHPNMRVFNWSAIVQPGYYIPDGIHYNSLGSAVLAADFAGALVKAFPATGRSPASCLVP